MRGNALRIWIAVIIVVIKVITRRSARGRAGYLWMIRVEMAIFGAIVVISWGTMRGNALRIWTAVIIVGIIVITRRHVQSRVGYPWRIRAVR